MAPDLVGEVNKRRLQGCATCAPNAEGRYSTQYGRRGGSSLGLGARCLLPRWPAPPCPRGRWGGANAHRVAARASAHHEAPLQGGHAAAAGAVGAVGAAARAEGPAPGPCAPAAYAPRVRPAAPSHAGPSASHGSGRPHRGGPKRPEAPGPASALPSRPPPGRAEPGEVGEVSRGSSESHLGPCRSLRPQAQGGCGWRAGRGESARRAPHAGPESSVSEEPVSRSPPESSVRESRTFPKGVSGKMFLYYICELSKQGFILHSCKHVPFV